MTLFCVGSGDIIVVDDVVVTICIAADVVNDANDGRRLKRENAQMKKKETKPKSFEWPFYFFSLSLLINDDEFGRLVITLVSSM